MESEMAIRQCNLKCSAVPCCLNTYICIYIYTYIYIYNECLGAGLQELMEYVRNWH